MTPLLAQEKNYKQGPLARCSFLFDIFAIHAWLCDSVTGLFFSDELPDAFPVHRIQIEQGQIQEVYVDYDGSRFIECLKPPSSSEIQDYLARLNLSLPDGYQTEINLYAVRWMAQVARAIDRGLAITIDYGHTAQDLYGPDRAQDGLPLLSALTLSKEVVGNRRIVELLGETAEELKHGKGLAGPMLSREVLPKPALQMIKVGEESGSLDAMLGKVAGVYDQETRATVQRMLTLLEPILIIGLGVIIAAIIMSILLAFLAANDLVL